mmetsp:Transcript_8593/g.32320  ORF Transcript_8593/g.32320 Transcript_8593/m.32320 type:complete len:674 (-) Transcript_8593:61-2082(-)
MVVYNFKKMQPVPTAEELVDIVLSRTQRKTPTVIRPGFNINRIRGFYMRKVKFTQQTASERLGQIIADFPRLNDIHPFYADLMNVLYDRDHYKLALGQLNTAKTIIDSVARDYVKLLKYGDSLYRCKQLKRAALGRMATVLKKHKASLAYLEEVRKHLSRLPALDPNTRTLICTGYPNVGKSSFLNKVTRANVDVQPYAFTTKALYVGHMDYQYMRWQVVDTPGLLDTPLEGKNTIEMQAITALAHLQSAVLFFIDISEECGFTIDQQCALFRNISPLFANKQLVVVCNKTDVRPWEELSGEVQAEIEGMVAEVGNNATLMKMSVKSEDGVMTVRNEACDRLLQQRVDQKLSRKKVDGVLNRLTVVRPAPRDGAPRRTFIPESVLAKRDGTAMDTDVKKRTEKDRMWENGGPGVYKPDYREHWTQLREDGWRHDAVPEIMDGKNIADFIDPEIEARLNELELEEEQLLEEERLNPLQEDELDEETLGLHKAIKDKTGLLQQRRRRDRSMNASHMPRTNTRGRGPKLQQMQKDLEEAGLPTEGILTRAARQARASKAGRDSADERGRSRKRDRRDDEGDDEHAMETDDPQSNKRVRRTRSASAAARERSLARDRSVLGMRTEGDAKKMAAKAAKEVRRKMAKDRRSGIADRSNGPKLQKHLIAGKMGLGTRRWR